MNVAFQSFLCSCRTTETLKDVVYESLDLSSLHKRITDFSFDIMLLDVLKPPPRNASGTALLVTVSIPSGCWPRKKIRRQFECSSQVKNIAGLPYTALIFPRLATKKFTCAFRFAAPTNPVVLTSTT
jgi:hypothetical protein